MVFATGLLDLAAACSRTRISHVGPAPKGEPCCGLRIVRRQHEGMGAEPGQGKRRDVDDCASLVWLSSGDDADAVKRGDLCPADAIRQLQTRNGRFCAAERTAATCAALTQAKSSGLGQGLRCAQMQHGVETASNVSP
jgi:hypothetical protein